MKISIILSRAEGVIVTIAQSVCEGAGRACGANVKIMPVDSIDADFVGDSSLIIFGTSSNAGDCAWQLKDFFNTTNLRLDGKIGGVFISENVPSSRSEITELKVIGHMVEHGMLICPLRVSRSLPCINFGSLIINGDPEKLKAQAIFYGENISAKAYKYFYNVCEVQ